MNFIDVIYKRRSVRSFLADPVPDEVLRELFEVARLAPSGGNAQNWVFGIIKDEETKIKLAKAAGNQDWIATAPVIIACWVGYLDIRKVSEILKLPEDIVCLFFMPIGYAKEQPKNIDRKTYEEIVFYEKWDKNLNNKNQLKGLGEL